MDGVAVLRSAFAGAHMWYLGTVADVGAEQANAVPPGIAHSIGALIAHIVHTEDFMFNAAVQNRPPLWERDGWGAKLGGEMLVYQEPSAVRAYRCDPRGMAEYAQAVFANTDAVLGGLADADLDRELDLVRFGFPTNMTVGAFLTQMVLGNTYAHTGEISSLKGSLAMKGYPF
jgi:uncharacterized damage-inducible protein DinB